MNAGERQEAIDRVVERMKKGVLAQDIAPELIFGWRPDGPVDHSNYHKLPGMAQYRQPESYETKAAKATVDSVVRAGTIFRRVVVVAREYRGRNVIAVVDGNTRLYGAAVARQQDAEAFPTVPVEFRKGLSDSEIASLMLALNMEEQGQPLNGWELAVGVKALSDLGMSNAEIAQRLGRKPSWAKEVGQLLNVARGADDALRAKVMAGQLSLAATLELASVSVERRAEVVDAAGDRPTAKAIKKIAAPIKVEEVKQRKAASVDPAVTARRSAASADVIGRLTAKARAAKDAKDAEAGRPAPADQPAAAPRRASRLRPENRLRAFVEWLRLDMERWIAEFPKEPADALRAERDALITAAEKLAESSVSAAANHP